MVVDLLSIHHYFTTGTTMSAKATAAQDPVAQGWLRAVLDLALLAVLTEGARHGYALAQRLAEQSLGNITGGVLYPALGRLEAQGVVTSTWQAGEGGPGRKVYELTLIGRDRLAAERAQWRDFAGTVNQLLEKTEDQA
jgi:PadR family transcriptional regulator, regulatory protein PadR